MSKVIARVATTGIVKQGGVTVLITKEAIESIPDQVTGESAIPYTADHNPYCLPIGKSEDAWIEPYKDGYAAMVQIHIEDTYSKLVHQRSGSDLICLDFEESPKPFSQKPYNKLGSSPEILTVDLANFADPQDYEAFANDVRIIDDSVVCSNRIQRHSLGPDPLIQIEISNPAVLAAFTVGVWVIKRVERFVRYTIDETLRKTVDDSSDELSNRLKKYLPAYNRHRPHDQRAPVSKLVIPGKPVLVLLLKTGVDEELRDIDLSGLAEEMERYGDILQEASSATFVRVDSERWEFQYCTTYSGKVIGLRECYEKTRRILDRVGPGISLGGYATLEESNQDGECIQEWEESDAEDSGL